MAAATGSASELPVPATPPPWRGAPRCRRRPTAGAPDEETHRAELTDHGGRRTGGGAASSLFSGRSATQLLREGPTVLRNLLLVGLAGVLLGLLYEGQYEKTRCDHLADGLAKAPLLPAPPTADEKQQWIDGCKVQAAEWSFSACFFASAAATTRRSAYRRQTTTSSTSCRCSTPRRTTLSPSRSPSSRSRPRSTRSAPNAPSSGARAATTRSGRTASARMCRLCPRSLSVRLLIALPAAPPLVHALPSLYFTSHCALGGRGLGQLILHLNSSRQLAGGVAALLCTVPAVPNARHAAPRHQVPLVRFLRAVGMEGLVALEFDPWAYGDAWHGNGTRVPETCCRFDLDPPSTSAFWSEAVPPYPACPVNATRYPWVPPPADVEGVRRRRPRQPLGYRKQARGARPLGDGVGVALLPGDVAILGSSSASSCDLSRPGPPAAPVILRA